MILLRYGARMLRWGVRTGVRMGTIPVYLPDGRCVGHVIGDEYRTTRRRSVHMLRQPPAWAIDVAILRELEARGVERVIVREAEGGNTYEAALRDFTQHGIRVNRGFGEQVALPLAYWRVDGRRSLAEQQADARAERPAQPALFGEVWHERAG